MQKEIKNLIEKAKSAQVRFIKNWQSEDEEQNILTFCRISIYKFNRN